MCCCLGAESSRGYRKTGFRWLFIYYAISLSLSKSFIRLACRAFFGILQNLLQFPKYSLAKTRIRLGGIRPGSLPSSAIDLKTTGKRELHHKIPPCCGCRMLSRCTRTANAALDLELPTRAQSFAERTIVSLAKNMTQEVRSEGSDWCLQDPRDSPEAFDREHYLLLNIET